MPGPGKGRQARNKKRSGPSPGLSSQAVESFITQVDGAEGWNHVVNVLCEAFELPDLTSRSGLKKVHSNFDAIYKKMDLAYEKNIANEKIRGGIVGIYSKMCVDSILRDKLFGKGFLDKLIPLLDIDSTRHLALRALVTTTHHGGVEVRMEIAKYADTITKIIKAYPDDEKVANLGVVVLAHSVTTVVDGAEEPNSPTILKKLDMTEIIRTVVETVRKPFSEPRSLIGHTVELLATATMHASKSYDEYPAAIQFLVAGMRSRDWITRCACLSGLLRMRKLTAEDDQKILDPMKALQAYRGGLPQHLVNASYNYGVDRTEMVITLRLTSEFQKAMYQVVQDRDLYSLGLKIAPMILMTEFSVPDGFFEVEDPVTGQRSVDSFGLPFQSWADALPHCAKAIRAKGKPGEQDWADILDAKHHIMRRRIQEAVRVAKRGLERNGEQAYFYYVITLSADNVQGLRAAKKGLKCRQITPFVKFQLLQRAVDHAGDLGIMVLQQEMPDDGAKRWEEGIAFLTSALEDSKTYMEQAPPDNRHMKNVGYWRVLLTVLLSEQLSPDLSELTESRKILKTADDFSEFVGIKPPRTNLRLAQEAVVTAYPAAIRIFSPVFHRLDESKNRKASKTPATAQLEDDLKAWLEDVEGEHGGFMPRSACGSEEAPKIQFDHVTLYRCSWCGNPSAVLRKCAGCGRTRYCDGGCQKSHWVEHKKICRSDST